MLKMYLLEVRKIFIGVEIDYQLRFQRCYGCPFYNSEDNAVVCSVGKHIWCSSVDYNVDDVIEEATYKDSMVIIT